MVAVAHRRSPRRRSFRGLKLTYIIALLVLEDLQNLLSNGGSFTDS